MLDSDERFGDIVIAPGVGAGAIAFAAKQSCDAGAVEPLVRRRSSRGLSDRSGTNAIVGRDAVSARSGGALHAEELPARRS